MTVTYRPIPEQRLILVRIFGALSATELMGYFQIVHPNPRINTFNRMIVIEPLTYSPTERQLAAVAHYAQQSAGANTDHRTAIVGESGIAFNVASRYQLHRELPPERLTVFRDPGEAARWLGLANVPAVADLEPVLALADDFYVPMHRKPKMSRPANEERPVTQSPSLAVG